MTLLESEDHPEVPGSPLTEAKLSTEPMGAVGLIMKRITMTDGKKAVLKGHQIIGSSVIQLPVI